MDAAPIVLATDFGLADAYVGMMRGVIAGINPAARVIDLTHGVGPQNITHGSVMLADSHAYFPPGSIFVAVVDPGVGTDRPAIVLDTPRARFVAPDNGLLTLVCREHDTSFGDAEWTRVTPVPDGCRAWRLTSEEYWRHPVSATFHGRDVFAPVAAHLSLGVLPDAMGVTTGSITALALPVPTPENNSVRGQVIYSDAFGNLVTDITADILDVLGVVDRHSAVTVSVPGHQITGLSRTFHDPTGSGLRALIGSHGRLEIAVVDGSARDFLGVATGASVVVSVS